MHSNENRTTMLWGTHKHVGIDGTHAVHHLFARVPEKINIRPEIVVYNMQSNE